MHALTPHHAVYPDAKFSRIGLLGVVLLHVAVIALLMQLPALPIRQVSTVLNISLLPVIPEQVATTARPELRPDPPAAAPPQARPVRRSMPLQPPAPAAKPVATRPAPAPPRVAQAAVAPVASAVKAAPAPAPASAARFDADHLDNPEPDYPLMARRLREEGRVVLRVQVSASGEATEVQLQQSSGSPRLDRAAIDTVQHWHFVPARRGAQNIAASVLIPIEFSLRG